VKGTSLVYPRVVSGALVGVHPDDPRPTVILFQYNPDSLSRTLQPQMGAEGGDKSEQLRLKGAPVETIKVDIELDATDRLERNEREARELGIHPQLAALESLVYPRAQHVITNTRLLALGTIEILPPVAPLTLFVWGPKRVLAVKLTELAITEEAHDAKLNPIRAKVSLGLRVLTYSDLQIAHPGYSLFLAHQVAKEALARTGGSGSLADVGGGGVNLR
jgi:Contractile injection system tube protein